MPPSIIDLSRADHPSVLFECVSGSRAYGTATPESDEDIRGIFAIARAEYLALAAPPAQVSDDRSNIVYYSLRRTIELLADANPNILELVYMPADCVRRRSPEMAELERHRDLFITRECAQTHLGYAFSQIKKARGQNKWINNPKPIEPPVKEDYCHVVPRRQFEPASGAPFRPLRLADSCVDLRHCHAAKLEHARDVYRLYDYGADARGVFRGDTLACESIPESDEAARFAGLLLYNEQAWKQAVVDHQNYWTWRRERNEARWRQQESGELDYDAKNLMHTIRLLLSGKSILEHGAPIVRFEGESLALLRDVRTGRYTYDEIMAMAQGIVADCERLKENCDLPEHADPAAASALLLRLTDSWESRCR